MLHGRFEELDEDSADVLQAYFEAFGKAVRAAADASARAAAAASSEAPRIGDDEPLQNWALRDLAARPLAAVLVGVRSDEDAEGLGAAVAAARGG